MDEKKSPQTRQIKKKRKINIITMAATVLIFVLIALAVMISVNVLFEIQNSYKESHKLDLEIKQLEFNLRYKEIINSSSDTVDFTYRLYDREKEELVVIEVERGMFSKPYQLSKRTIRK